MIDKRKAVLLGLILPVTLMVFGDVVLLKWHTALDLKGENLFWLIASLPIVAIGTALANLWVLKVAWRTKWSLFCAGCLLPLLCFAVTLLLSV